jgi:hypothetical protein
VGRPFAASTGRSLNARACPRKDFRAVFFLRKFFRNSVSFNVAHAPVFGAHTTRTTSASDPAATNAPRKNLILPHDKIADDALPSVCRKTPTCG